MKLKWLGSVSENKASWTLIKYLIFVNHIENKVSRQVIACTTLTVLYSTALAKRESSKTENTWFESQVQNRNLSPSHERFADHEAMCISQDQSKNPSL